jgi:DNA-binding GntR family transcriptional regulator
MSEYLYLKIYEDLKNNIINGTLANGERLPTEKDLIEKLYH